jgi:hypothetical protein
MTTHGDSQHRVSPHFPTLIEAGIRRRRRRTAIARTAIYSLWVVWMVGITYVAFFK